MTEKKMKKYVATVSAIIPTSAIVEVEAVDEAEATAKALALARADKVHWEESTVIDAFEVDQLVEGSKQASPTPAKKTFRLAGDILKPGVIEVEGVTLEDAVVAAEAGNFQIVDEQDSNLGFKLSEVLEEEGTLAPVVAEPPNVEEDSEEADKARFRAEAIENSHQEGVLEIDDDAKVSLSRDEDGELRGAYVAAWLWVDNWTEESP